MSTGSTTGTFRVAEKIDGTWVTHQWIKKAVLLYFRTHDNRVIDGGEHAYFDKVPMRFAGYTDAAVPAGRLSRRAAGRGAHRQPSSAATSS